MGKYWAIKTDNVDTVSAQDFNTAFDSIEADIQAIEGSAEDTSQFVKKTDYATTSTPGVVMLADSGNPGNNPAVMTEDALGEYLEKNNYAKSADIPSYSAGKHIEIDSSGKISAAGVQSYSEMSGFSGSVLLTPQDMLDMVPLALSSSGISFTDESRAAARANLKAAKDSVVSDSLTLDSSGYVTAIGGYALYKDIEGVEL